MATRDYASSILKQMEDGTRDIYSRYQNLISASDSKYDALISSLDSSYQKAQNQILAKNKINLENTLTKLADKGLNRSGQSMQTELVSNAGLLSALGELRAQKASDTASYNLEKEGEEKKLLAQRDADVSSYRTGLYGKYLDQLNRDREYESTQAQRDFENSIKSQYLALEKAKSAAQIEKDRAAANKSASESSGLKFEIRPNAYLAKVVEQYTTNSGYKTIVNKTKVRDAVKKVIQDSKLSQAWRYELMTFAKSVGYL